MPYRDPEAKREWELRHRAERLAHRRELRRIKAAQPEQSKVDADGASLLLIPLLAGSTLAAFSPKVALGAGVLTLLAAMHYRKGWEWWLVGALTLLLAFVFWDWEKNPQMATKK